MILIDCGFSLDQMLSEHVAKIDPLIESFNLTEHLQYSTHTHWENIGSGFNSNSSTVFSLLSPYNDHLAICFKSNALYSYRI